MISLLDRDVVFFGGKGGVGKTTCSAAFALSASRSGRRTLLVSTDPAHSTSDIFERRIGASERELQKDLWALEIDGDAEAARYISDVKRDIQKMFSAGVVQQAHKQIEMAAAFSIPLLLATAPPDRPVPAPRGRKATPCRAQARTAAATSAVETGETTASGKALSLVCASHS